MSNSSMRLFRLYKPHIWVMCDLFLTIMNKYIAYIFTKEKIVSFSKILSKFRSNGQIARQFKIVSFNDTHHHYIMNVSKL